MRPRDTFGYVRALLARALGFGALLWILAEGHGAHPVLSGLVALAAAATSLALVPVATFRLRLPGLVRFVPWFLAESVQGGLDVAGLALRRSPSLEQGFVDYPLALVVPAARTFFASVVSLLPGTLAIELRPDGLRVHVLDVRQDPEARLRPLEKRVGAMFAGGEAR